MNFKVGDIVKPSGLGRTKKWSSFIRAKVINKQCCNPREDTYNYHRDPEEDDPHQVDESRDQKDHSFRAGHQSFNHACGEK